MQLHNHVNANWIVCMVCYTYIQHSDNSELMTMAHDKTVKHYVNMKKVYTKDITTQ